jgi:hypothetical protein
MSSAIVDAAANSGGSRMTSFARIVEVLLVGLPPGKSVAFYISIIE